MKAVMLVVVMACALVAARQDALEAASATYHVAGAKCKKPNDCGGGLRCNLLTSKCERVCTKAGDACKTGADCCSSTCRDGVCLCFDKGATCTWGDECCDGSCSSTKGCCRKSGTDCETHNQCCSGICQAPVAAPALIESDATPAPAKKDESCDTPAAAGAKKADAKAAPAKAAADKPAAAKPAAKKAAAPAPAKAAPKKMQPASKQCCSDFGQKCSDSEPCCPPNICSDLLGMCTLAVKIE